jgi:hypothetical protein
MGIHRILPCCLALLLGCSGSGRPGGELPPLVPARGEVTRGGQPVPGGLVQFRPVKAASAHSNLIVTSQVGADGTFELATTHALSQTKGRGAPPGDYTVTYLPPGESQDVVPVTLPGKVTITNGPNNLTLKLDGR